MTIVVATEFTRSGAFAIWESGSFNPQTDNGWACLVANPEALPQRPVFERNVAKSKHHYLFRVVLGSLVVVTNIQRMPNSRGIFSARVLVGKVTALHTHPNEKNPTHLDAESQITPLWSESFLAPKADLLKVGATLSVSAPSLEGDCLEGVYGMIRASLDKALTPATEQRMFWGSVREAKTVSPSRKDSPIVVQGDDIHSVVTGRISSHEVVAPGPGPSEDTTSARGCTSTVLHMDEAAGYPAEVEVAQDANSVSEEHDGSINTDSMSLCGLSSNPLPPLQVT
jgi:hypothetical protein